MYGNIAFFETGNIRYDQTVCNDYDQINIILKGKSHYVINDRAMVAGPGDVVFLPKHVTRDEHNDPNSPMGLFMLLFYWHDRRPEKLPLIVPDANGRITQMARWLLEMTRSYSPNRAETRNMYLIGILGEYVRLADEAFDEPIVRAVRDYVAAHMQHPITLDDLAAHVNYDRRHLIRKHKALTGQTPMAAVRTMRLERARELILSTSLTLKEIAEQIGLANEYHLSRLFKHQFNLTTRQLRGSRGNRGSRGSRGSRTIRERP